jgi:hypothetical protein
MAHADETTLPPPPAELGERGRAFWTDLCDKVEFDRQSLERLRQVCRLLDLADRLQVAVDAEGLTVIGSTGQSRIHPAIGELRQVSSTVDRLLVSLDLPDDDAKSGYSRRGLAAARARWSA